MILLLFAAFNNYLFEPRLLAGNTLALSNSSVAIFHNPSLISDELILTTTYAQPFSIQELNFSSLAISFRGYGLGIEYLGEKVYREFTLAGAKKMSFRQMDLGMSIDALVLSIEGEKVLSSVVPQVGFKITPATLFVQLGASLKGRPFFNNKFSSSAIDFAIAIKEGENLMSFVDLYLEPNFPYSLRLSEVIKINEYLKVGLGITTNPNWFFLGFTLRSPFILNYGFKEHFPLGPTHAISFTYMKD